MQNYDSYERIAFIFRKLKTLHILSEALDKLLIFVTFRKSHFTHPHLHFQMFSRLMDSMVRDIKESTTSVSNKMSEDRMTIIVQSLIIFIIPWSIASNITGEKNKVESHTDTQFKNII